MSAWQPETWYDGLFIGAEVWSRSRYESGLIASGKIFGVVWDSKENGAIVEFEQEGYWVRYFVNWKQFEEAWVTDGRRSIFSLGPDIRFVELREIKVYENLPAVEVVAKLRVKGKRVPVWSQYWENGETNG